MIEFFLGVLLLIGLFGFITETLPHWKEKLAAKAAERQRECDTRGHDWDSVWWVTDRFGRETFPVRNCKRCHTQQHLDKCPGCGKACDRGTHRPVEDDAQHPDDPS